MNTFLSEAQQKSKESYETFAREEVAPKAASLDNRSIQLKEFLSEVGQRGYLGMTVPQEYGGKGFPFLEAALFAEAIAQQEPGLGFTFAAHTAVIELLKRFGSDTQKSRYLPLLAQGDTVGTVAFTEATAGTDVLAVQTTVKKVGDGYSITGKKTWVVNGDIASLIAVLAKAEDDKPVLLLVEGGASGTTIAANRVKMGLRSASANDIEFADVKASAEGILGSSADTAEQIAYAADISKVLIAAAAVGLVEGALAIGVEHAKTRTQFGALLATFQAIQWKVADMSAESTAARMLTYRAAWSKDEAPDQFRKNAAMCKYFAAKTAKTHSGEAISILGSLGLDQDCITERFYRDAKTMEIAGGTAELQKLTLVKELDI